MEQELGELGILEPEGEPKIRSKDEEQWQRRQESGGRNRIYGPMTGNEQK